MVLLLFLTTFLKAQDPQAFKYQAIVRDTLGNILSEQDVQFRIRIINSSNNDSVVYGETYNTQTSKQGLVQFEIGKGIVFWGAFKDIQWGNGVFFVKIEMKSGTKFIIIGYSQFLSVPYALYAQQAANAGPTGPSGEKGETGDKGENGLQGIQGEIGTTGPIGQAGLPGPTGPIGVTGPQGIMGDKGDTGPQGIPGIGLTNKGLWKSGNSYTNGDYVFAPSKDNPDQNSMWIFQGNGSFISNIAPSQDNVNWIEFKAPAGPTGIAGSTGPTGVKGDTGPAGSGSGQIPVYTQQQIDGMSFSNNQAVYNSSTNCLNIFFANGSSYYQICGGTCQPQPTTPNAGPDQISACSPATLAGNIPVKGTGLWTIVTGTGGTLTDASKPNTTFIGTLNTTYVLRWTISNGCNSLYDDVIIYLTTAPTQANAGPDQINVCAQYTNLAANTPSVGSGTWTILSGNGGSITNSKNPVSTFTGTSGVVYTLRWTISSSCGSNYDDVNISFNSNIPSANAGSNQLNACLPVTIAANTPSNGTGLWTVISGSGGSITDASSPSTTFTGTPGTSYTLRWTVTTSCGAATSDVILSIAVSPITANAGQDQYNVCSPVTLAANTVSSGTGTWTITAGSGGSFGNTHSPTSSFIGTVGITYILRWTISNNCSNNYDEVVIKIIDPPLAANAGPDQLNIDGNNAVLAGNMPVSGTGIWTIISGNGGSLTTPNNPTTVFSGLTGYTYTLRWTITSTCTTSYDDVIVSFGPSFPCGTSLYDSRDGQSYRTVLIGNQCWMRDNLNYGSFTYSFYGQTNNGIVEKFCYNEDPSYCSTLGGLYIWNELMNYTTIQGAQGICPSGWHVPSDQEYKIMEVYLGMPVSELDL